MFEATAESFYAQGVTCSVTEYICQIAHSKSPGEYVSHASTLEDFGQGLQSKSLSDEVQRIKHQSKFESRLCAPKNQPSASSETPSASGALNLSPAWFVLSRIRNHPATGNRLKVHLLPGGNEVLRCSHSIGSSG